MTKFNDFYQSGVDTPRNYRKFKVGFGVIVF